MTKAAELAKMGEVLTNSQIGGRRNLIINGAMQVAQRGTSFTGVSNADYTLDRFESGSSGSELVYDVEQSTDAPSGFSNSYKVTVTTEETTLSAGDNMTVRYNFEGQDLQQLKKGTSDAEKVTVSFYVKSSVASTYSLELFDQDNTRVHGQKYTITSADTWEYKTITFDGDTSGSLDNDANKSMRLQFWLDAGSEYTSGTQSTTWQANTASERVEQSTGFMTTANATWQLTGVQLEVGSQTTPFEHRSYGEELALCQRYFQTVDVTTSGGAHYLGPVMTRAANNNHVNFNCPVTLRAQPTLTVTDNGTLRFTANGAYADGSANSVTIGGTTLSVHTQLSNFLLTFNFSSVSGVSTDTNRAYAGLMLNSGKFNLDAEF